MRFVEGTPEFRLQQILDDAMSVEDTYAEVEVEHLQAVLESLATARGLTATLVEQEPERPSEFGFGVVEVSPTAGVLEVHAPFYSRDHATAGAEVLRSTNVFFQMMGRNQSAFHIVDLIAVEDGAP